MPRRSLALLLLAAPAASAQITNFSSTRTISDGVFIHSTQALGYWQDEFEHPFNTGFSTILVRASQTSTVTPDSIDVDAYANGYFMYNGPVASTSSLLVVSFTATAPIHFTNTVVSQSGNYDYIASLVINGVNGPSLRSSFSMTLNPGNYQVYLSIAQSLTSLQYPYGGLHTIIQIPAPAALGALTFVGGALALRRRRKLS
jgi:hypothetical protein